MIPPPQQPLWWETFDPAETIGPPLERDLDVDVAIVGAGYTGLWTAHYLLERDPRLRIAVVERAHVGFGASGRNGGWAFAGFAAELDRIEADSDLSTGRRFAAVLRNGIAEIGDVLDRYRIDADYQPTDGIEFLRNEGQLARAVAEVETSRRYGWREEDLRLVGPEEAATIARAADALGAIVSGHNAAVHPAKLVRGLARSLVARGVQLHEATPAVGIIPGRIDTPGGRIRATRIVRATEAYTAELPGLRRLLVPLYSLMVATAPLPQELWDEIGLAHRELFADYRHLLVYGQRTADGRIAFGGRGAPYRYSSAIRPDGSFPDDAFAPVHAALVDIFPQLRDVPITHRWSGVLGVTRRWYPAAVFDRVTGMAWAGGYVGSGIVATNLAGRTLADLLTGASSELTSFPWVRRRVRRWEPEPLRWLGINAALRLMRSADRVEQRTGRPARRAEWMWKLVD